MTHPANEAAMQKAMKEMKDLSIVKEISNFIKWRIYKAMSKAGVLFKYKNLLPVSQKTPMFTMGEGDTPLVKVDVLARKVGCRELYFKLEGCNPTGSFKDRGMVVAIAKAMEDGSKAIICASTGNTSASAAAYAAYSGLLPVIIIPKGKIALGKLAQAIIFGAKTIVIDGNFDEALKVVRALTEKHPIALVNSINPIVLRVKNAALRSLMISVRRRIIFIPVGNAGNITAIGRVL
jgi:threonine synthase